RHGGSGLACPDHIDVAEAVEIAAGEVAGNGVGGIGRGERGAEDGQSVAAEKLGGHGRGGVEFEGCDSAQRRGDAEMSPEKSTEWQDARVPRVSRGGSGERGGKKSESCPDGQPRALLQ